MQSKAQTVALFFPGRMDQTDKDNLAASKVLRVQVFLGACIDDLQNHNGEQLHYLHSKGVAVTIRVEEPNPGQEAGSYYNAANHGAIVQHVKDAQAVCDVEAVIAGNEPQHTGGYDLTWSSPNWGNNPDAHFPNAGGKAQAHNNALALLIPQLKAAGVKVVTPGWAHERITPRDPAEPGRASWRELCLPSYNMADGGGAHIYAHAWAGPEDENRYLWTVGEEEERLHRAVWVNETAVNTGTPLERMYAFMRMYDLVAGQAWAAARIASFTLFVSNGSGQGYNPGYVITLPAAYDALGQWMAR